MLKEVEKTYPDLTSYAEDVREVAVLRLMRQLAQVYDKISISKVTPSTLLHSILYSAFAPIGSSSVYLI